jgi:hypothetical protein
MNTLFNASNVDYLPWFIVAILIAALFLPKSNGGKTDIGSRLLGLLGIRVKKNFEDVERDAGVVGEDGFDKDLYVYRVNRLAQKLDSQNSSR